MKRLRRSLFNSILNTVGVHKTDSDFDAKWIAKKLLAVRLFESDEGKTWNKSAKDHGYGILAVSQFTLYAFLKVSREC